MYAHVWGCRHRHERRCRRQNRCRCRSRCRRVYMVASVHTYGAERVRCFVWGMDHCVRSADRSIVCCLISTLHSWLCTIRVYDDDTARMYAAADYVTLRIHTILTQTHIHASMEMNIRAFIFPFPGCLHATLHNTRHTLWTLRYIVHYAVVDGYASQLERETALISQSLHQSLHMPSTISSTGTDTGKGSDDSITDGNGDLNDM